MDATYIVALSPRLIPSINIVVRWSPNCSQWRLGLWIRRSMAHGAQLKAKTRTSPPVFLTLPPRMDMEKPLRPEEKLEILEVFCAL